MRKIFLLYLFLQSFLLHAQTKFEPGYFINNEGVKTACLIRNLDWYKNPDKITFKLEETSREEHADILEVQEFSVNTYVFKRFEVAIDRARDDVDQLDRFVQPTFKDETLFLQLIVDGPAKLYRFRDTNLMRFFMSKEPALPQQLVFKRYITAQNTVGQNDTYKHQILETLKCETINILDTKDMVYREKDLADLFTKYNTCIDPNYTNAISTKKRGVINIYIRPGVHLVRAQIENQVNPFLDREFESTLGYRVGLEVEGILPFNNNKWALLAEPTFQQVKLDQSETNTTAFASMDYTSLQLPLGFRYRMYLNSSSVVYVNALFLLDFPLSSQVEFEPGSDLELYSSTALQLGIGYNHKQKYSLELRYATNRNVFRRFIAWKAEYSDLGIYLGYNLIRR